ncbi:cytochrome b [Pseudoalteromonas peptidolytica]|uniref:cytochrome b n=1 Tax=Pseudoalteromonas peptidolytica TaxID=61150 RepID=UPI00298E1B32|nr:cytochrome b/b6 domain-containing protein [Pseudoalteromonas peptidolytica]MDW7548442.1 cytochrome b/b6 domain-containing protein [Pseudoalteromonas peptidolytica]
MKSYPNLLVLLHWILVPAILIALFMGNDIASLSNDLDLKVDRLKVHMFAGLFIGVLFVIRLIIKMRTTPVEPLKGSENSPLMNKLALITHRVLYVLVFLIVLTGIAMSAQINLLEIIQLGGTLPEHLSDLPARRAHGILTTSFAILILLHSLAALYHHFILKDGIFSRMWFSKVKK